MKTGNKSVFISFEGGEGSGKSTQIRMLRQWLEETISQPVVTTREPGGTPGGEAIRELIVRGGADRWDAETDTLLFMASRRDLLNRIIWPSLAQDRWVLCDRFVDSTYAYQAFGRGLALADVQALYHFVARDFLPDITFLLDLDPRIGLNRVLAGKDRNMAEMRYESFDAAFHDRLRQGYHTLAAAEPNRFFIIDATADIEVIQNTLRQEIQRRFAV